MSANRILLIYPPTAKPGEAPAGIARLAGVLKRQQVAVSALDANLEGLHYLLGLPGGGSDTWTRRARRGLDSHLSVLSGGHGFENNDRYRRAVSDLNRLLHAAGHPKGVRIHLADYQDGRLSPLRSRDLCLSARYPERNIYFPYFSRRIAALLKEENPSAVGFSINYLSQALCAFAMAGFVKQIRPDVRLTAGGGLITSWLSGPVRRTAFEGLFDQLVAGAGERALLEVMGAAGDGRDGPPDYSVFASNRYLSPGLVLPYSASSGCYWNRCAFCPERAEKTAYRPLPVPKAIADLKALSAAMNPALIHLLDNAVSPKLMEAIAKDPPGPPWYGFARITAHLADPDFCRALKRSGCLMLQLGLESGDQRVLDGLEKGVDLKMASAALNTLKQAGIATYVYLLFGTAAETRHEALKTLDFTVSHHEAIGFLNLAVFNLPVGSPQAQRLNTDQFYEGDLSLYADFEHPGGWHRKRVRRFLDKTFTRHPAIAPIVRRDPPVFTSNHAPFFVG